MGMIIADQRALVDLGIRVSRTAYWQWRLALLFDGRLSAGSVHRSFVPVQEEFACWSLAG
jgi:hypothetical protein